MMDMTVEMLTCGYNLQVMTSRDSREVQSHHQHQQQIRVRGHEATMLSVSDAPDATSKFIDRA